MNASRRPAIRSRRGSVLSTSRDAGRACGAPRHQEIVRVAIASGALERVRDAPAERISLLSEMDSQSRDALAIAGDGLFSRRPEAALRDGRL